MCFLRTGDTSRGEVLRLGRPGLRFSNARLAAAADHVCYLERTAPQADTFRLKLPFGTHTLGCVAFTSRHGGASRSDPPCGHTAAGEPATRSLQAAQYSRRLRRFDLSCGPGTHGRKCASDRVACILSQDGPPGTPCVCQSSYGPIKGVIVRR